MKEGEIRKRLAVFSINTTIMIYKETKTDSDRKVNTVQEH